MRFYTIHLNSVDAAEIIRRGEEATFIKEGISWPALFIQVFWLIYHRLWIASLVYIAVFVLFLAAFNWLEMGILGPLVIIAMMGWEEILFTAGMLTLGILWFIYYAGPRVDRHGAIYHVFERLGRLRYEALDVELRGILKEKGLRAEDPFDEVVVRSSFIEAAKSTSFEKLVRQASSKLARLTPHETDDLEQRFLEGTRIGATPVTKGIALPHIRLPDVTEPHMVVVRSITGIKIDIGETHVTEPSTRCFF